MCAKLSMFQGMPNSPSMTIERKFAVYIAENKPRLRAVSFRKVDIGYEKNPAPFHFRAF